MADPSTNERELRDPREREQVHEAAHDLGERRKDQMAQGEIFKDDDSKGKGDQHGTQREQ